MKKTLFTFLLLLSVSIAYSQSVYPAATDPNLKIFKEAEKLWKNGDYVEAEKLYRKAYTNSGNVYFLAVFAKKKFEISDVKSANAAYDIVIKELTEYLRRNPRADRFQLNFYYQQKINNNFRKGNPEIGLATSLDFVESMGEEVTDPEQSFFQNMYYNACETAFFLDNENALVKLHEKASGVKNGEYGELLSFVYLNLVRKDYPRALEKIEDVLKNGGGFTGSKMIAKTLLPVVYATMGENEKALQAIDQSKSSILIGEGRYQYLYGIIALNQKKYQEAIDRFNTSIKGFRVLYGWVDPVGKYKHYTKGLKHILASVT